MSKPKIKRPDSPHLLGLMLMTGGLNIEASEARGAAQMVASDQLPHDGLTAGPGRDYFIAMGGKIVGPTEGDEMFLDVILPPGWAKRHTDHSMWTDLVDEQGRKRGSIFYKAAFYDRSAHLRFDCRFHAGSRCDDYQMPDAHRADYPYITDGGKTVWRGTPVVGERHTGREKCEATARTLLTKLYPKFREVGAYWDVVAEFPPGESTDAGPAYIFSVQPYGFKHLEDTSSSPSYTRCSYYDPDIDMFDRDGPFARQSTPQLVALRDSARSHEVACADDAAAIARLALIRETFCNYDSFDLTIKCGSRVVHEESPRKPYPKQNPKSRANKR